MQGPVGANDLRILQELSVKVRAQHQLCCMTQAAAAAASTAHHLTAVFCC